MNFQSNNLLSDVVQWCNLCNKAPADGVLTVLDADDNVVMLDACEACVIRIPKKDWVGKDK